MSNVEVPLPFGPEAGNLVVTQAFNDTVGSDDHNDRKLPFTYSLDFARASGPTLGAAVKAEGSGRIVSVGSVTPDTPLGDGTLNKSDLSVRNGYRQYLGPHDFGNYVTIKYDDGFYATYMHLQQAYLLQHAGTLYAGAPVKLGDTIGLVGSNGAITGPHLHVTYGLHDIGIDTDEGKTTFTGTARGSTVIDLHDVALADGSIADNPEGDPVHFLATENFNGALNPVTSGVLHESAKNSQNQYDDFYIANNAVTSSEGIAVTSTDQEVSVRQASNMDGWFFASDTDGDPIQYWAIEDQTPVPGGGYFHIPGGWILSDGKWSPVGDSNIQAGQMVLLLNQQLAGTTFVGGSFTDVQERLAATAYDGHQWGNWTTFNVTTNSIA